MSKLVHTPILVLLVSLAVGTLAAVADDAPEIGIPLTEGLWVFDVQIRMPMQTSPTIQKTKACIGSEPLTAERLMPWAEKQGCRITGIKAIEGGIKWKLRCKINGQRSKGSGEFTVSGDRGQGMTRVNFEMAGQRMSISTKWDAKRMGECPAAEVLNLTPGADPAP